MLDALASLPDHLRVVVVLRYYGALSEREIASVIHHHPGDGQVQDARSPGPHSADGRLADLARIGNGAAADSRPLAVPAEAEALGAERRWP